MENVYLVLTSRESFRNVDKKTMKALVDFYKEINKVYEVYQEVEIDGKVDYVKINI